MTREDWFRQYERDETEREFLADERRDRATHQANVARAKRYCEMLWMLRQDIDEDQRLAMLEEKCAMLDVETWEAFI